MPAVAAAKRGAVVVSVPPSPRAPPAALGLPGAGCGQVRRGRPHMQRTVRCCQQMAAVVGMAGDACGESRSGGWVEGRCKAGQWWRAGHVQPHPAASALYRTVTVIATVACNRSYTDIATVPLERVVVDLAVRAPSIYTARPRRTYEAATRGCASGAPLPYRAPRCHPSLFLIAARILC
jgi:hypothetical protein